MLHEPADRDRHHRRRNHRPAQPHPVSLDDDDRFRLAAIADTNESLLAEVADRFHIPSRHVDYRRMLEHEDVESVVICHSGSHRDSVLAALDTGKDILVEKPLAWNLREVREIAARAAESDRIVQLGYHKLCDPAFAVAKQEVEKIADLGYARIAVLHPAAELNYTHVRIRKGGGKIQEGYREPAGWAEQMAAQRSALASGSLGALTDEALGSRKGEPLLRQFYGTLNISLIHSIYMMFGFLGAPARLRSVQLWRDTMLRGRAPAAAGGREGCAGTRPVHPSGPRGDAESLMGTGKASVDMKITRIYYGYYNRVMERGRGISQLGGGRATAVGERA